LEGFKQPIFGGDPWHVQNLRGSLPVEPGQGPEPPSQLGIERESPWIPHKSA
jgi:hypothetical protein